MYVNKREDRQVIAYPVKKLSYSIVKTFIKREDHINIFADIRRKA